MSSQTGRGPRRQQFDPQEEIKKVILDRGLRPGDSIPTEAELMTELGMSRGSLREALKSLQARGIIEVRHGRGMFVAHPSMDSLVDALIFRGALEQQRSALTTASELVDIRDILEAALVQQVAVARTPELLAKLDRTVADMDDAVASGHSFHEADRRFHEELYSDLDNALVLQLVQAFWDVLDAVRPQLGVGVADDPVTNVAHHRRIVERVRAGDPDGARQAMVDHFRGTHAWIQGARK